MTSIENPASIHEGSCVLSPDHYGPCAPSETEFFVVDGMEQVLWRGALPPDASYSDDPQSDYQQRYKPLYDKARTECLAAAFRLGFLPLIRHHSRWTESMEWPIQVREIEDRGDLVLTLPMGEYILHARRARKGETTSEVTVAFNGTAVGFGRAAVDDTDSLPLFLNASVHDNRARPDDPHFGGCVYLQPSSVTYTDGTHSGFLGCDPVEVVPLAGYPRQIFRDGDDLLEEPEGFDPHAKLSERRRRARSMKTDILTEGLYHSGYTWNSEVLSGLKGEHVSNTYLTRYLHPTFGACYTFALGNSTHLLATQALVEMAWRKHLEKYDYTAEKSVAWLRKYGPRIWREQTTEIGKNGCAGTEMHEWNAARGGFSRGEFARAGATSDWVTLEVLQTLG